VVLQRELPLLVPLPLGSQQVASRQVASLLVLRQQGVPQGVPQLGPREVQARSYSTVSVWFVETTSYPARKLTQQYPKPASRQFHPQHQCRQCSIDSAGSI
jgi:hypothetical protein